MFFDSTTNVVNRINNANSFTVTGRYTKGVVNNQSNNDTHKSIAVGTITIHQVRIIPKSLREYDIEFINDNKFKVASIYNNK